MTDQTKKELQFLKRELAYLKNKYNIAPLSKDEVSRIKKNMFYSEEKRQHLQSKPLLKTQKELKQKNSKRQKPLISRRQQEKQFPQEKTEKNYIKGKYQAPPLTQAQIDKLRKNTLVAKKSPKLATLLFNRVIKKTIRKKPYWIIKDAKGKVIAKTPASKQMTRVMVTQHFNKKTRSFDKNITANQQGKKWATVTVKEPDKKYGELHQVFLKASVMMYDTKTEKRYHVGVLEGFSSTRDKTADEMLASAKQMILAQALNKLSEMKNVKMQTGRYQAQLHGTRTRWIYRYIR